jgi:hypothetical protein
VAYAEGTYLIVFESGVLRFDDDGALHIHLTHSEESPHPFGTDPDGTEGAVPGGLEEVVVQGSPTGRRAVEGTSFPRANALPEGLVVTIRDWELVKVEASGDLSVLVEGVKSPPDWFEHGKIQRFAGPDESVKLYFDTSPIPPPREPAAPKGTPAPASTEAKGGCVLMVLALLLVLLALQEVPLFS